MTRVSPAEAHEQDSVHARGVWRRRRSPGRL